MENSLESVTISNCTISEPVTINIAGQDVPPTLWGRVRLAALVVRGDVSLRKGIVIAGNVVKFSPESERPRIVINFEAMEP